VQLGTVRVNNQPDALF